MIGHLCNQDHCREYGCIELKKQARHLYTKPTLTPLQQFNEEVRRDIDIHFDKNFEFHGSYLGIRDFFLERLQAHKSLILKMVREKFPEFTGNQNTLEHARVWQICRKKFLNNLDTI